MKQWWKKHAGQAAGVLVLLILAGFGLTYWREIWAVLTQPQARDAFIEFVRGKGALGVFIFLGIQLLQVVVAFLPGEAVELAAGLLYGTWGGLCLCLLGIFAASCMVYFFVRLFGAKNLDEKKLTKYHFLRDEARIRFSVFLVFFIPGTPKDLLTYLGPFLPIPAWQFLAISTLARIPSVLTSTFAASQFAEGSWQISAAVFAVTGLAALLCLLFEEHILTWFRRRRTEK